MSVSSPYASIPLLILPAFLLSQPVRAQTGIPTKPTAIRAEMSSLPAASHKITVAVYPFRIAADQQYQPTQAMPRPVAIASYTALLFEVLRTSNWFVPIEYGNAGKLLNSHQAAPLALSEVGGSAPPQQPTLILEAGLFSHDTTPLSAETAASYMSSDASGSWQQDQATVFIRALSVQTGQILKTVYWTRTILSQPTGTTTYRYALLNQPNSPLTGTTSVDPDQLVIVEAMKQAVDGLVIEGVRDGLWVTATMPVAQTRNLIAAYEARRLAQTTAEKPGTQPRKKQWQHQTPSFIDVSAYGGWCRYHGDYVNPLTKGAYGVSVDAYFIPYVGIQLNAASGTLASRSIFSTTITALEANLLIRALPYWRLTPLLYGGAGVVSQTGSSPLAFEGRSYLQYQGGLGIQYSPTSGIGLRAMLAYNMPQTDLLDGKQAGSHNDFYVRTTLGLVVHIGQHVRPTR